MTKFKIRHGCFPLLVLQILVVVQTSTEAAGFLVRSKKHHMFSSEANKKKILRVPQLQSSCNDTLHLNTIRNSNARIRGGSSSNSAGTTITTGLLAHTTEESTRSEPNSQNYYLLNSYSAWRSILLNTCALLFARILIASASPSITMPQFLCHLSCKQELKLHKTRRSMVHLWNISLPLLSSSCCAIQLFLNAIAGAGCAGFNTVLGPLRPFFVSMLLFTTIMTSFSAHGGGGGSGTLRHLILSWAVALMPECVHFVNQRLTRRGESQSQSWSKESASSLELHVLPMKKDVIELDIKDMGCVACIHKIDGALRKSSSNVIESSSWLNEGVGAGAKGGKASVSFQYANEEHRESLVNDIISSVTEAGFDCALHVDK